MKKVKDPWKMLSSACINQYIKDIKVDKSNGPAAKRKSPEFIKQKIREYAESPIGEVIVALSRLEV